MTCVTGDKPAYAGDSERTCGKLPFCRPLRGLRMANDSIYPRLRGLALGYTLLPTAWATQPVAAIYSEGQMLESPRAPLALGYTLLPTAWARPELTSSQCCR